MSKDTFSLREGEIFETLKALAGCSFVVIGGYAVNAYALPRFSVDCDLVVKDDKERKRIERVLARRGYKKEEHPAEDGYGESFRRYGKTLDGSFAVSIDILIKKVTDRTTGAIFEADWIFDNSMVRALKGKTISQELKLRIINGDALLVMKMISCRPTDIRDVFMMIPNARSKEWIRTEIERRCDLRNRIKKIVEKVNSKQFKDGLAGVYGFVDQRLFDKHKKAIVKFAE